MNALSSSAVLVWAHSTGLQAHLDATRQICRKAILKHRDILPIDGTRKAQRRIHHPAVQRKEVLRDLARARVVAVQGRHEDGVVAGGVLLEVDGAHREDGTLEGAHVRRDLGGEVVLEHEARVDLALDDGQELGGARVDVRRVEAAGAEDGDGDGDAEVGDDGEGVAVGEEWAETSCEVR